MCQRLLAQRTFIQIQFVLNGGCICHFKTTLIIPVADRGKMNFPCLLVVFGFFFIHLIESKRVPICSDVEVLELLMPFEECTKQVSLRLKDKKFEWQNSANANETNKEVSLQCQLVHDSLETCGPIYKKCLDEKQYK